MKSKINNSKGIKFLLLFSIIVIISFSCSKKSDDTSGKNNDTLKTETAGIDNLDITESDSDLANVDYKEIYDELSSKGEWVQVNGKELGMDLGKNSAEGEYDIQRSLIS